MATGAIVFIFEEKVGGYTRSIKGAERSIKGAEGSLDTAAESIKKEVAVNQYATATLLNLVHAMKGVNLQWSVDQGTMNAESWYLLACHGLMHPSGSGAPPDPAMQRIFKAYWYEEASDITRHSVVTNARNYTSFLIAAVEALQPVAKDDPKLHFYTTTPAGPHSLLNWPDSDIALNNKIETFHRERDFISAYMLFVRELVLKRTVCHRRWIWSRPSNGPSYDGYPAFLQWRHYEKIQDDNNLVVGVPVPVVLLADESDRLRELRFDWCTSCSNTHEDVSNQIKEWKRRNEDLALVPVVCNAADTTQWNKLVQEARMHYTKELQLAISSLITTVNALRDVPDYLMPWLEGWKECVTGEVPRLLPGDDWLPKLQVLEASLMVAVQTTSSRRSVSQGLKKISRNLVRLRWHQIWLENHNATGFPTVQQYVDGSFQTIVSPDHYVLPAVLKACEALQHAGPEFAILGTENNIVPGNQAHALPLGNDRFVHWKLVLRSTISSPWIAGRVEICTPASHNFGEFCSAIKHLHETRVATPGT